MPPITVSVSSLRSLTSFEFIYFFFFCQSVEAEHHKRPCQREKQMWDERWKARKLHKHFFIHMICLFESRGLSWRPRHLCEVGCGLSNGRRRTNSQTEIFFQLQIDRQIIEINSLFHRCRIEREILSEELPQLK